MSINYTDGLLTDSASPVPNSHELEGWPDTRIVFADQMKKVVPAIMEEKGIVTRRFNARTGEWGDNTHGSSEAVQGMLEVAKLEKMEPRLSVVLSEVHPAPPNLTTAVINDFTVDTAPDGYDGTVIAPELTGVAFAQLDEKDQRIVLQQAVFNTHIVLIAQQTNTHAEAVKPDYLEACCFLENKIRTQICARDVTIKIGDTEYTVPFPETPGQKNLP